MTYYSALHYAAKAESAATRAETAAAQAESQSGKIVQLGFDGAIEDGKLVFKHAPSGVEVPYELLDDYEYGLDLSYNSLEDLSGDVQMYVKNGNDTVTFVSALHRDSTSYATVDEMSSVMRFNADTGYRWLFKAAYKIAPNGTKVLLLYPVISTGGAGAGLEIGDIGFAPLGVDEAQNKRRYLNGQVISQSQFVSFTNKIKSAIELYPNLATSETNWQAEVTNSKLGQCGKFVIDDTLGTIRLPKVVNINGLQDLALMGSIKAESLPNILGKAVAADHQMSSGLITYDASGYLLGYPSSNLTGAQSKLTVSNLNANNISSTYQDNAPVQQEAIQYPYFIQVATGVEESVDVTREIELNNPFSLLDYKWSEYELNNASWLISNGAFHSGATYPSVYELLLKIQGGAETKDGVSVKLSTEAYADIDFVINTADTTFRLPIKVKLASGNAVVGNGKTLVYTDGTKEYGAGYYFDGTSQIYTLSDGTVGTNVGTLQSGNPPQGANTIGITTNPENSGLVLADNDMYLYFYVGETVQDANIINASGVLARVAELSDEHIVGLGIPDYSAGIAISSFPYTAPSKGFIDAILTNATSTITVNGSVVGSGYSNTAYTSTANILVDSGDVISMGTVNQAYFYPLKGVN